MATFYFVGDGTEVLACEAWKANAFDELQTIAKDHPELADHLAVYECDPSELCFDGCGEPIWAYPQERFVAQNSYELPTVFEALGTAA